MMEGNRGEEYPYERNQGHHGTTGNQPPLRVQLTREELQVLRECNRESFWYRCVPLSIVLIGSTQIMINRGILKPNARFGSLFKNMAAALVAFIAGKMSYQGRCREKILQLENSALADAIRHGRRRGVAIWNETPIGQEPAIITPPYTDKPSYDVETEYDANRVDDRQEFSRRPSDDSDAPLPVSRDDLPTGPSFSYEELRRRNRAEHEKQLYESRPGANQQQPPSTSSDATPPPTSSKPHVKRNKWGDEVEV